MGYCADVDGSIKVKEAKYVDLVLELLEESEAFEDVSDGGNNAIFVTTYGWKYHEEDFPQIYGTIAPYIESADIEFTGDDGEKWKHSFEDGQWLEYQGEIHWVNPYPFA